MMENTFFKISNDGFTAYCDAAILRLSPYVVDPAEAFLISMIGTGGEIDAIGASLFQSKPVVFENDKTKEDFNVKLCQGFTVKSVVKKTDFVHKIIRSSRHIDRKVSWQTEPQLFGVAYGPDLLSVKERSFLIADSHTQTPLLPDWTDWLWDEVFHPEQLFSFGNEAMRETWMITWPDMADFDRIVLEGIRAGYLSDGTRKVISLPPPVSEVDEAEEEDVEEETTQQTVGIGVFLEEWGDQLKEKVLKLLQPIYTPKSEDSWDQAARQKLQTLKRPAYPGQITKGILPIAKALYNADKKAAFNVGVMGTGKTQMALSVAFLDPAPSKRILVMCPGHLVHKWIREAKAVFPEVTCHSINGPGMELLVSHKLNHKKPKGVEVWVLGKERAKLHYQRKISTVERRGKECCPSCGEFVDYKTSDLAPFCKTTQNSTGCGSPLWTADNKKFRRYAKSDFMQRYFPKNFFDLVILDEIHELSNETAQGQAMASVISRSKKVLALTGTLMGGYSRNLFYLLFRMFPKTMVEMGFAYGETLSFARRYGVVETTFTEKKEDASVNSASIGTKSGKPTVKEVPGISPELLPDLLLEHATFVQLSDVSDQLPTYDEIVVPVAMTAEQDNAYQQLAKTLTDACKKALQHGDMRLMGKVLQSLLAYPDGCRNEEIVTLEVNGQDELIKIRRKTPSFRSGI